MITFRQDIFNAIAPELSGIDGTTLEILAECARLEINEDVWKTKAEHGLVLLTAHMAARTQQSAGVIGSILEEKVGDLSRKYSGLSGSDLDDYKSTKYGMQFLRLRKQLQISPFVVC